MSIFVTKQYFKAANVKTSDVVAREGRAVENWELAYCLLPTVYCFKSTSL